MDAPAHQAAAKPTITTVTCPYCNEHGLIKYVISYGSKVYYMPYDYNPAALKGEALKREAEISTIQNGCEQPVDFTEKKKKLGLIPVGQEKKVGWLSGEFI